MSNTANSEFIYTVGSSVSIALTTAAGTQFFARLRDAADRRRTRYAEIVQTLVAWVEFPYRIRRRVDDEPATLSALAALGHFLQEQLAGDQAWGPRRKSSRGTRVPRNAALNWRGRGTGSFRSVVASPGIAARGNDSRQLGTGCFSIGRNFEA